MPISQTDLSWRRSTDLFDPLDQVQDMISKYELIQEPSFALRYIIGSSKLYVLFCELIEHQVDIIMSRSQDIEDGQVTVYDKCLLDLCRNGEEVHRLAAQEFYLREFMGVDPGSSLCGDVEQMLDKEIIARGVIVRCSNSRSPSQSRQVKTEEETSITHSQEAPPPETSQSETPQSSLSLPFSATGFDTYGTTFATNSAINTNIIRMLHTYFEAKSELYQIEPSSSSSFSSQLSEDWQKSADAAKFLRDSAENALDYLQAQDLIPSRSDELVGELQTVFKYAKSKAIELLGGRKRRFEVEKKYHNNKDKFSSSSTAAAAATAMVGRNRSVKSESSRGYNTREYNIRDYHPRSKDRRVTVDRYYGLGSRHHHSWHPYARHEGSRSRSGLDKKLV